MERPPIRYARSIGAVVEFVTGQRSAPAPSNRRLVTVILLGIVGSTECAAELGDARWRELLAAHYARAEREITACDDREVDREGEGMMAVFEGPTRAIRCARSIQREARGLGLELRGGIHTGEVELDGEAIRGIAVHTAARVCEERRGWRTARVKYRPRSHRRRSPWSTRIAVGTS